MVQQDKKLLSSVQPPPPPHQPRPSARQKVTSLYESHNSVTVASCGFKRNSLNVLNLSYMVSLREGPIII